ncbi:MAG TPA: twin-arginine translocase subunit TatC, partial [Candidatus Thermoplasmatota archaeon]|nr:twin-arginine translocase subunit TatC [Candidatus Thermoplasmatota archaeon]
TWRAAAPDALLLEPDAGATAARATFDWTPSPYRLASVVVPERYARYAIEVRALDAKAPQSEDAAFARAGEAWAATLAPAEAGATVRVRVVDPHRVGELPVLLVVLALALLVLLAGVLWHAARPPLGGREPTRFLDHLAEVQARLVPPAVAFVVLNLVYFGMGLRLVEWRGWTLVAPTLGTESSLAARAFAAFAERLVPAGVDLVALRPVEAVLAQVQTTLFLAAATVLPLLLYEAAAFLAPALLPRERRVARTALPLVGGLLLAGALFGYLVMAPLMMRTLYAYAPGLGARPLLAVSDLVSFTLLLVAAFAVAFELPVAMYALARLGVVRAATFRRYVRHAIVAIAVLAGVLTPDPSVVSQLMVAVPVTGLYLLGIAAAAFGERRRARAAEALPAPA